MKLLDILARELEEWPEGYSYIVQEGDGELYRSNDTRVSFSGFCTWDGDGDYFHPGLFVKLATDHSTAIITREMWEEARAKIQEKKAMPKTNKDGWIRHRGGKCPVDKGVLVDVRRRDGSIDLGLECGIDGNCTSSADECSFWQHDGDHAEIMAYRIHKPDDQAIAERRLATMDESKTVSLEHMEAAFDEPRGSEPEDMGRLEIKFDLPSRPAFDALSIRDRIHAIDAEKSSAIENHIMALRSLNDERQELVQRLEAEGLMLCQGKAASVEAEADMSDWRNWKIGDRIECMRGGMDECSKGDMFTLYELDCEDVDQPIGIKGEDGFHHWPIISVGHFETLKWHSRPKP